MRLYYGIRSSRNNGVFSANQMSVIKVVGLKKGELLIQFDITKDQFTLFIILFRSTFNFHGFHVRVQLIRCKNTKRNKTYCFTRSFALFDFNTRTRKISLRFKSLTSYHLKFQSFFFRPNFITFSLKISMLAATYN